VTKPQVPIPSVDEVLRTPDGQAAIAEFGRTASTDAIRAAIANLRVKLRSGSLPASRQSAALDTAAQARRALQSAGQQSLRRVFNLTGTLLHTNLGRAVYAPVAIEAATTVMGHPAALEFNLATGGRGERDDHVRALICRITGAQDAIVVNNNAAAVLLVLAALAFGRETIVSRGELIEIGGSFRMPTIMASAGTRLVEVGTTNRTHLTDYSAAIGSDTALLMKVHTSNYRVEGFTTEVTSAELAPLARERGIPLVDDLGSGTLIDLTRYGLSRERTVQDALDDGADIVTFSGDKLLGGPQAGIIAGRKDLVQLCARHPIKRAVRLDKVRLAALEATLKLYADPDTLAQRLPALAAMARPLAELRALAARLLPALRSALAPAFEVDLADCASQIGSGALPLETIPSVALAITPVGPGASGGSLDDLASRLRSLPIPVIGRIAKGRLMLDLRGLDGEDAFLAQLAALAGPAP
jgi:L-seryl-tRNA(Ser) seleniumtransferase